MNYILFHYYHLFGGKMNKLILNFLILSLTTPSHIYSGNFLAPAGMSEVALFKNIPKSDFLRLSEFDDGFVSVLLAEKKSKPELMPLSSLEPGRFGQAKLIDIVSVCSVLKFDDDPGKSYFADRFESLESFQKKIQESILLADSEGFKTIAFHNVRLFPFNNTELAWIILKSFEHALTDKMLRNLRYAVLSFGANSEGKTKQENFHSVWSSKSIKHVLPRNLQGGDIIHIQSFFHHHRANRAVIIKKSGRQVPIFNLLHIGTKAREYRNIVSGTLTENMTARKLYDLGLYVRKESIQKGHWKVKIGEKLRFKYNGIVFNATLAAVGFHVAGLILNLSVQADQTKTYLMTISISDLEEAVGSGTLTRIDKWRNSLGPVQHVKLLDIVRAM